MTERWAKYKDRPNLRQALLAADALARLSVSSRGTLEHAIVLGKRPCTEPYTGYLKGAARARRLLGVLVNSGLLFEVRPDKTIRILEGEEARTERMRRLMVRHEMEPDGRPAIEAQMVALDAEMEGRTP